MRGEIGDVEESARPTDRDFIANGLRFVLYENLQLSLFAGNKLHSIDLDRFNYRLLTETKSFCSSYDGITDATLGPQPQLLVRDS